MLRHVNQLRAKLRPFWNGRPEVHGSTLRVGREHFIPLQPSELVDALADDPRLPARQRRQFHMLCQLLETTFHHESQRRLRHLKEIYALVNPDADTERLRHVSKQDREDAVDQLFAAFVALLERANFRRLTREDIEGAIGKASEFGVTLHVDLHAFEQLDVFARGSAVATRTRRRWRTWFRPERVEIPLFQRLVVIFRLKSDDQDVGSDRINAAYIRLFKNVPQQDVDMTLPGTRVRMSLLDTGKIILPTLSGIGLTIYKIVKGALLLAFAGIYGLLAVLALLAAAVGYGLKSVSGYVKTKNRYELNLTRNLYYQNLDNNEGVLFRLTYEAEAQELREAILAYHSLWLSANDTGWTTKELDKAVETTLRNLGLEVDFEVSDALEKLSRLGLCSANDDRQWHATSIEDSIRLVSARNQALAVKG